MPEETAQAAKIMCHAEPNLSLSTVDSTKVATQSERAASSGISRLSQTMQACRSAVKQNVTDGFNSRADVTAIVRSYRARAYPDSSLKLRCNIAVFILSKTEKDRESVP